MEGTGLEGGQLAELLAADPLSVLASLELVVRVMCRPSARAAQLREDLNV
jgi:hypothetical protein